MERLSGLDAGFLSLETPHNHMHVASTIVLDPSTAPAGWSFERVRSLVDNRLPLVPPFRRRLISLPFGLGTPRWIEDPAFELDYHLRRAALPAPGGYRELADLAAELMGRPLDRERPLWEMYVVEGLERGMVGVVLKTHHAAIDGVLGAELLANLLDLQPEPLVLPPPEQPWAPEPVPSELELLTASVTELAQVPASGWRALRHTLETARHLLLRNRESEVPPPPAPFTAPHTSLNRAISAHRRLAVTQLSLDEVKAVKEALGGTVNDVVLATCAGALRAHLESMGERPVEPLVAMVPVSLRGGEGRGSLGNQVSAMLVSLATTVADPVARLGVIAANTRRAKDQDRAVGTRVLTDWAEVIAPALFAPTAWIYSRARLADRHRPLCNLIVSNLPGPDIPLYLAGARVQAAYPMAPIFDGIGLNITVLSYQGSLFFGLVACRETVPGVWDIAHRLQDALDELKKAARAARAERKRGHRS